MLKNSSRNNLILAVFSIVFALLIAEFSCRVFCKICYKIPFFERTDFRAFNPLLGWEGKLVEGDLNAHKFKIFFVGDSFTEGRESTEGKRYFDVVRKALPGTGIFIYGEGGYGTMQEYLVINKYIDRIKPDLVVLQFCDNDFINNSWSLEKGSYINNNGMVRPYWENGRIAYHFPRGPVWLRKLASYSRIAYFVSVGIDKVLAVLVEHHVIHTVEKDIEAKGGEQLKDFKKSVSTTRELIRMIKARCGKAAFIAFPVSTREPYYSQSKLIFNAEHIDFLDQIPVLVYDAEDKAKTGRKNGSSHWSDVGHFVAGEYLARYIYGQAKLYTGDISVLSR